MAQLLPAPSSSQQRRRYTCACNWPVDCAEMHLSSFVGPFFRRFDSAAGKDEFTRWCKLGGHDDTSSIDSMWEDCLAAGGHSMWRLSHFSPEDIECGCTPPCDMGQLLAGDCQHAETPRLTQRTQTANYF